MSEDTKKKPELVSTETFEGMTNAQLVAESAKIDAEMKQLDLELKREQVSKLRSSINQKKDNAKSRDIAIKNFLMQRDLQQSHCNHHKGGTGAEAFLTGQGSDAEYCVIKHRLPCGRYFVLCQRCGKEWHPAQAIFGIVETPGYTEALGYTTKNVASGSGTFTFERTTL